MRPREVPVFLRWKTLAHWLLAAMQGLIPPGARGNLTAYNQLLLKKQLEPTVLVALFEKRVEKKLRYFLFGIYHAGTKHTRLTRMQESAGSTIFAS